MSDDAAHFAYFAYGSNLDPSYMRRHPGCAEAELVGHVVLPGWRLAFRGGLATIEIELSEHVEGILWRVPNVGLAGLDRYEGFSSACWRLSLYRRELVRVRATSGLTQTALVYVMNEDRAGYQPPDDERLQPIQAGYEMWGISTATLRDALSRAGAAFELARGRGTAHARDGRVLHVPHADGRPA